MSGCGQELEMSRLFSGSEVRGHEQRLYRYFQ